MVQDVKYQSTLDKLDKENLNIVKNRIKLQRREKEKINLGSSI